MDVFAKNETRGVSEVREVDKVMDVSTKKKSEIVSGVADGENLIDVSVVCGNGTLPPLSEAETVWCASNGEDNSFDVERLEPVSGEQVVNPVGSNDVDVNIIEDANSNGNGLDEAKCDDETECSSSFVDTNEASSDAEVESQLHSYNPMASQAFQISRKNVSDQWRRFTRPLMSSCKLLELKIHEIKSVKAKYCSEIAKHDERKQYELGNFTNNDSSAKLVPFSSHMRETILRRTKRKRVEDAADVASFMPQYNVFSYFEKKRHVANGASLLDYSNLVNFGRKTVNGDNDFVLGDQFSPVELLKSFDSCEEVIRKIKFVKSHVQELKSRIDKVVFEIPAKFSSINMLSYVAPRDALTASYRKPDSLGNGDKLKHRSLGTSSHHISKCRNSILKPETGVSSDEEVVSLPDMTANIKQLQDGGSCNKIDNDILINNRTAKEELQNFGSLGSQLRNQASKEENNSISAVQDDKLPPVTSMHGAISNEGNSSSRQVAHITPKRKRRRRRHRWGF